MSKILSILLVVLISQFTPMVKEVYATDDCNSPSVGISYGNPLNGSTNKNTFFTENTGDLTLEFTIADNNALKGKEVFLHLPGGIWLPGGGTDDKNTPSTIAVSPKFQLTIDKSYTQAGIGPHQAELWWLPDPNKPGQYASFCWSVRYNVGVVGNACNILQGPPQNLPVSSSVTIVFLGKAKQEYTLRKDAGSSGISTLDKVSTDDQGIGNFTETITGTPGDKFKLVLIATTGQIACQTGEITITSTAVPQPSINPSASIVPVPAPAIKKCGDKDANGNVIVCSKAGGEPCDNNTGFKTAIGCIHTTPKTLVEDVLRFATGIGGGLAFIMMLFGAFQMMTSGGNPQNLQGGKDVLQNAIIGLLFIIFSILLMKIIGIDILNIPGFS